jgi:hypothetical protein
MNGERGKNTTHHAGVGKVKEAIQSRTRKP